MDLTDIIQNTIDSAMPSVDQNNNNIQTSLLKLMQESAMLKFFYQYFVSRVIEGLDKNTLFKNNIKLLTIGIFLIFATSMLGMLSYFMFYVLFFFSSLKCVLWLFEAYTPDKNSNEAVSDVTNKYVSEFSPTDILEYYIVPIFIVLIIFPLSYIPLPFLSFFANTLSVLISIACLTNKSYRQRFCLFARDLFTDKTKRDANGRLVPGSEGEVHKLLQTLCYTIECINMSTFNITHNPRSVYNNLNNADNIVQAFGIMTNSSNSNSNSNMRRINHNTENDIDTSSGLSDEFDEEL